MDTEKTNKIASVERVLALIIRTIGCAVMLVGIYIGLQVISEVWDYYYNPDKIDRFVIAVESGSNLNSIFKNVASARSADDTYDEQQQEILKQDDSIRLAYFVAWLIVLALLLVIAIFSAMAITAGGKVALYGINSPRLFRRAE